MKKKLPISFSYSDPKCDDCKGFIKNWSTAVQHDKMLIANATDYFNGTDFCASKTPPGGLGMVSHKISIKFFGHRHFIQNLLFLSFNGIQY